MYIQCIYNNTGIYNNIVLRCYVYTMHANKCYTHAGSLKN